MSIVTQPLRDEHKELYPNVDRMRQVAEIVDNASPAEVMAGVAEVYQFLAHHLLPHASAEEAALYPVVQKVLGSADATKTMSRDHVEIEIYIKELEKLQSELDRTPLTTLQIKALQRVLYGAYALVKVHFAKEEEVYLPILDERLSADAAREMFEAMEAAAHKAMHAAGA